MNSRSELPAADALVHTIFTGTDLRPNSLSLTMGATTRSLEDETPEQGGAQVVEPAPATEATLGVSVARGRCAVCSAELASDQRYCVECGTRRGAPRFVAKLASERTSAAAAPAHSSRRPSAVLAVVVIATLLIAFGVGLLVGHDTGKTPTVNVQVHDASGGTSGANAGSSGSSSNGGSGSSSGGSGGSGSNNSGSGSNNSGNFFH